MKKFDIKNLDIKLLMIFKAVFEEGSVTGASDRMSLSQPLISHALDRLRVAFSDPLFVRAGRTIAPTTRAIEIAPLVNDIIEQLSYLTEPQTLDKSALLTRFSVAANDFERRIVVPNVFSRLLAEAPHSSMNLSHTSGRLVERLRMREWDLVITPLEAPDLNDFYSEHLFKEKFACFFDPSQLSEKDVVKHYGKQQHAIVRFQGDPISSIDKQLASLGITRDIKIIAPSFEALPEIMAGTKLVATLPTRLSNSVFKHFAMTLFPFVSPELNFKMIWHKTTHYSSQYKWLRSLVTESAKGGRI